MGYTRAFRSRPRDTHRESPSHRFGAFAPFALLYRQDDGTFLALSTSSWASPDQQRRDIHDHCRNIGLVCLTWQTEEGQPYSIAAWRMDRLGTPWPDVSVRQAS